MANDPSPDRTGSCCNKSCHKFTYEAQVRTAATGLVIPPTNSIQAERNLEMRKKKHQRNSNDPSPNRTGFLLQIGFPTSYGMPVQTTATGLVIPLFELPYVELNLLITRKTVDEPKMTQAWIEQASCCNESTKSLMKYRCGPPLRVLFSLQSNSYSYRLSQIFGEPKKKGCNQARTQARIEQASCYNLPDYVHVKCRCRPLLWVFLTLS
jgi:hypothetical protein